MPDSLSAKIRMQPGFGQGAGLPVQVLPGRRHSGVPDQRAGQVHRLGREQVVLIGTGDPAGVSVTLGPYGKRRCRSYWTRRLLNTFFRQSSPAGNRDRGLSGRVSENRSFLDTRQHQDPSRRALSSATSAGSATFEEVTGGEALRAFHLEPGDDDVVAGVGVQRLLAGGEGAEQREARLARHHLIVPLQQKLDLDGDPGRRLGQGLVAGEAETAAVILGSAAVNGTPIPLPHRHAPETHRPARANAVKCLERIQGGLPLGNCPRRQRRYWSRGVPRHQGRWPPLSRQLVGRTL